LGLSIYQFVYFLQVTSLLYMQISEFERDAIKNML